MPKTGRLIYEDINGTNTEVRWWDPTDADVEIIDFCGTGDPLNIKWNGDRYGVTFASSATIRLLVQTLEQRVFLESVFNGGFIVEILKAKVPFWRGKVTPTLGIGRYMSYPYELQLNANDGIADAKRRKLLATDFPEPFADTMTPGVRAIDILVKIIDKTLQHGEPYNLYITNEIYTATHHTRVFENTWVDPLVFMNEEDDNYISIDDMLTSLLGPFSYRLFQWQSNWYCVQLDALWDNGDITLDEYQVTAGVPAFRSTATTTQDLVDLYSCSFTDDYEINNNTNIEFIAPWLGASIKQSFQMNYNIFPAFANRNGNFYSGKDGVILELEPVPVAERLRHWTKDGMKALPFKDEDNEGSVQIPTTTTADQRPETASVSVDIDPSIQFNKFFFSISTITSYLGEMNSSDEIGIKKVFNIEYDDTVNKTGTWWLWRDNAGAVNDPDAHDKWEATKENYVFDHNDVSVEGKMPDGSMFTGGKFTFTIHNCYDANFHEPDYAVYLNSFKFGIVSSQFKLIPFKEKAKKFFQKEWVPIVGELLLSPMPLGIWSMRAAVLRQRDKNRPTTGGVKEGRYEATDVQWADTIEINNINNKATTVKSFEYRWGLNIPGLVNHHEFHLSSPYDQNKKPVTEYLVRPGLTPAVDLMTHKSNMLTRDNQKYTTKLSGNWVSDKISPFRVVHDLEGRVYNFAGGTWNDKYNNWACDFIEFKGLQGDHFPGTLHQLVVGTDGIRYGLFAGTGTIDPALFDGLVIEALFTQGIHQGEGVFSVGAPIPGISTIKIHFIYPGDTINFTLVGDNYIGNPSTIHNYMEASVGETINVYIEKIP